MCYKLSAGKAYVRGFDVYLPGTTVVDIEKPRDTKTIKVASIPFNMGSLVKLNHVIGSPFINIGGTNTNVVQLYNQRRGATTAGTNGIQIGEARVYSFGVSDAPYSGTTTEWDLHLYDIQTFTILKCNSLTNASDKVAGTRVRGLASGAIGYLAKNANATGVNELAVSQTTGAFINGEQIIFNEKTATENASIVEVLQYTTDDIKMVYQDTFGTTGISTFAADTKLYDRVLPSFSLTDQLNVINNSAVVNNRNFAGVGIKTDTIIAFNNGPGNNSVFNRISNISNEGKTCLLYTSDAADE